MSDENEEIQDVCLELEIKTDFGWIKTYYLIDSYILNQFTKWYYTFNYLILDSGLEISQDTLKARVINSVSAEYKIIFEFINNCGKPFDIIEQIEELDLIFNNDLHISESDTDSDLYTQTDNINNIISAHIQGDEQKVKMLLEMTDCENDDVIETIRNKYK